MLGKLLGIRLASLRCPTARLQHASFSMEALRPDKESNYMDPALHQEITKRKKVLYDLATSEFCKRNRDAIETSIKSLLHDYKGNMHAMNIVLRTRILLNDANGIRDLMAEMSEQGCRPNLITYNLLVSYYRNLGRIEDAMEILKRMEAAGVAANTSLYTTLINGWREKGDYSMVENIFQRFLESGLEPDLYVYNSMMLAYFRQGKPEEARKLAARLLESGLKPNYITYKLFIRQLVTSGRVQEAERLYNDHLADCEEMKAEDQGELVTLFQEAHRPGIAIYIFNRCMEKFGTCSPSAFASIITVLSTSKKDPVDSSRKISQLEEICLKDRTIFSRAFQPLLRHHIFHWKDHKNPEYLRGAQRIYKAAKEAGFGFPARLEELCRMCPLDEASK